MSALISYGVGSGTVFWPLFLGAPALVLAFRFAIRRGTQAQALRPQWRCEKNGHLLDPKRQTCPIDGSHGVWLDPM